MAMLHTLNSFDPCWAKGWAQRIVQRSLLIGLLNPPLSLLFVCVVAGFPSFLLLFLVPFGQTPS